MSKKDEMGGRQKEGEGGGCEQKGKRRWVGKEEKGQGVSKKEEKGEGVGRKEMNACYAGHPQNCSCNPSTHQKRSDY